MILVYLSAARASNAGNIVVRASVIHDAQSLTQTEVFPNCSVQDAKMDVLEIVLKSLPWTKEAVTVFLNDEALYQESQSLNAIWRAGRKWKKVAEKQSRFGLTICYKNKGALSDYMDGQLQEDIGRSLNVVS